MSGGKAGKQNLHVWLKGLRRVGEEEDVEEGESIDPHGGGGGFICQGEDDAWRRKQEEEGIKEKNRNRKGG